LLASALFASRGSVNDSMTLQVVQDYQEAQRLDEQSGVVQSRRKLPSYGQQRLWGAAGWGGASMLGGLLMDSFGVPFMFMSSSVLNAGTAFMVLTQFPSRHSRRTRPAEQGAPRRFFRFEVIWFLVNLFIHGIFMSLVETFLFIFLLRDFKGSSNVLLGFTIAVMCLFELPVFFYVDRLIKRFELTRLLSLCHIVFSVRCLLYSVLPRCCPATVLLVEPLHGITFAMMWSVTVEYGKRLSPQGSEAKMQALINGLYIQLAMGFGSLFWGPLTEPPPKGIGFTLCYQRAAGAILAWSVLWNLGWWIQQTVSRSEALLNTTASGNAETQFS